MYNPSHARAVVPVLTVLFALPMLVDPAHDLYTGQAVVHLRGRHAYALGLDPDGGTRAATVLP